jgi:hypothetical protein
VSAPRPHPRSIAALVAAATLALAPLARASAPEGDPVAAPEDGGTIAVDLAGLEPIESDVRAGLVGPLITKGAELARAQGVLPEQVRVVLTWKDPDAFVYKIRVVLEPPPSAKDRTPREFVSETPPDTTETKLVELALAAVEHAVSQPEPAPPPATEGPKPEVITPPPADESRRKKLSVLGWIGVAAIVAGAGVAGAGGGLVALDRTRDPDDPTKLRDWQPGGIGMIAGGAAVLVAGIVMVAVDATRQKKAGSRRAAIVPALAWGCAGVTAVGRF